MGEFEKRTNYRARPKDDNKRPRRRFEDKPADEDSDAEEGIVAGRNPVIEALKSGRTVEKIFVAKGSQEGSINVIMGMARDKGIVISEVDRRRLDEMAGSAFHQGVVAQVTPYQYSTVDAMLEAASEKGEDPFIIILDEIEDPHNLGSIVRSANVCGAHGVIIPKRRSASITQVVAKTSAGAVEHTKIAKVTNITQTIKDLKDKGLWIIGTDMDGEVCYQSNLKGPIALVVGSEGKGIGRLIKKNCDMVVSIPMSGEINSLNAAVAGGILMYEVRRQRSISK